MTKVRMKRIWILYYMISLEKKIKMKNIFSGPTKLHLSPYYRGCTLWSQLPEDIQKAEIL